VARRSVVAPRRGWPARGSACCACARSAAARAPPARASRAPAGTWREYTRRLRGPSAGDAAVVELHDAIAQVVVAIVVTDDEHRLAARLQLGQELAIEDLAVVNVLVGRPLVEDVDRPVFHEGDQERQPFALPLGERGRGEGASLDAHLLVELEADQMAAGALVEIGPGQSQQIFEEVEVRE